MLLSSSGVSSHATSSGKTSPDPSSLCAEIRICSYLAYRTLNIMLWLFTYGLPSESDRWYLKGRDGILFIFVFPMFSLAPSSTQ